MNQTFALTSFARSLKADEDEFNRAESNISSVVKLIFLMSSALAVVDAAVRIDWEYLFMISEL